MLEKILKALVVRYTKTHAPYTHHLLDLAKKIGSELDESDLKALDSVNDFNILGRYPDWKLEFHKKCTKEFAESHLSAIKRLYSVLCQKLEKKR